MRKRPLCIIAALFLLVLWMIPKNVRLKKPDIPSGEQIVLTGTVAKREQTDDKELYYLKDCRCSLTDSYVSVLAYTEKGHSYPIGCTLSLYGTIYQLNKADNPGQFDAELYYQSQGILYTFQSKEEKIVKKGHSFIREAAAEAREFLADKITELYDERDAGILKAVLLADKSTLGEEDRLLYQKNGISHLLAISGLHISLIGIALYRLLRKLGATFLEAGILSGAALLFYGLMTGFGVSTFRAVSMFLVMVVADIAGRAYDMASAMALAALLIVWREPLQVWQAGFLLSFGAVFGICAVYPALEKVLPVRRKLSQTIFFSLSITLVTYPLCVHFYYEYPVYSTLLNLVVIPCMPLVMGFGAAGTFAGMISPALGRTLGFPAHLVLSLYEFLGEQALKLPFALMKPGCERPWQLIVYYIILVLCLLLLHYGRKKRFLFLIPAALLIVTVRFRPGMTFTMLDVGQGDALFLRMPGGTTCLIDGGSSNVKQVGKYRILPYLNYEGVAKLDYVIFSHMDADHTNGVEELLNSAGAPGGIEIGTVLFPASAEGDETREKLAALAEKKKIAVGSMKAGDRLEERKCSLICLFPSGGRKFSDKNDGSLVLLLEYGDFELLLTGDLGMSGERELLEKGLLTQADVWKVSHHGSDHSGSEEFLREISPKLSLISVGRNNRYGHPGAELLGRLFERGCDVRTTMDGGALMLWSDGEQFSLSLQREEE